MIAIKKARPLGGGVILFHHDYVRRCAKSDRRFYFGRNAVLVFASYRMGTDRPRHGCLGWISLDVDPTNGSTQRLGVPQIVHGQHGLNVFKGVYGTPHSIGVALFVP